MNTIFLSFIKLNSYSGQSGATLQIERLLRNSKYKFKYLYLFPLDRSDDNKFFGIINWIFRTVLYSFQILQLFFAYKPILYINLGQSLSSFFRVLWWFFPLKFLRPNIKVVVSLHGNSFLSWDLNSKEILWFKRILRKSDIVTVLSERHIKFLENLHIKKHVDIRIVNNTNDNSGITKDKLVQKNIVNKSKWNILFLSLLIETKGYIEYLEAMKKLAELQLEIEISAILCGPINISRYCQKFNNHESAQFWIEKMISEINRVNPNYFSIEWIDGAYGEQKDQLFANADIFVFPTRYPNESMPLVLLEAMSSGCAIISSNVGEIDRIINDETAIVTEILDSDAIVQHCVNLFNNHQLRVKLVENSYIKVNQQFSSEAYKNNWIQIFDDLIKSA